MSEVLESWWVSLTWDQQARLIEHRGENEPPAAVLQLLESTMRAVVPSIPQDVPCWTASVRAFLADKGRQEPDANLRGMVVALDENREAQENRFDIREF